jgi:serine/threonine protein kinase
VYNNAAKTSDGRPEDEMTASVLAATIKSEGTIKTIARFRRGNSRGLVMQYLDHDSWKDLGKPPSFDTVARDTYDENVRFTAKEIMAVARDIGSALRELHAMGVVHGDVYAHNILYVKESPGIVPRAKLGDFGAAWFYEKGSPNARTIELNEARAFGAVLEEVSARHDGASAIQSPRSPRSPPRWLVTATVVYCSMT